MKIRVYIMPIISFLLSISCSEQNVSDRNFEKAIIYYNSNTVPWGLMKVIDVSVGDFLQDSLNLRKIVLTDKDSLRHISENIIRSKPTPLAGNDYIDTAIAVLLFSQGHIDTLATNAYPQSPVQFNDENFMDSVLVYHLIDIIRAHDPKWDEDAKEYYYNGAYNTLPQSFWDQSL